MADLLDKLPEELDRSPEAALLGKVADRKVYNIVHLNYRPKDYEGPAKDYEFSRRSIARSRIAVLERHQEASLLSTSRGRT